MIVRRELGLASAVRLTAPKQRHPIGERDEEVGDLFLDRRIVDRSVGGDLLPGVQHEHFRSLHGDVRDVLVKTTALSF